MHRGTRRCTNLALSPAALLRATTGALNDAPDWPQFRDRRVLLTHSCRTAIALIREALDLEEGDVVLAPGYNCGTEIDALVASGLEVRAVDVERNGSLDLEALERAVCQRTRLIYVIHQFGWPQRIRQIDAWRRNRGLLLAEDCALALFGELDDGEPIGLRGEACVFSLTKSLPVPDGGALTWTTAWDGPRSLGRPSARRTTRGSLSLARRWVQRQRAAPQSAREPRPVEVDAECNSLDDMPSAYYFEPWRAGLGPSGLTRRLLRDFNWREIRDRRRENYLAVSERLHENGLQLLFDSMPEGVCPLACPVIIDQRDEWVAHLWRHGVATSPWWAGGHRSLDWKSLPEAVGLKRSVLPVPVHQQLDVTDMELIASVLGRPLFRAPVDVAASMF